MLLRAFYEGHMTDGKETKQGFQAEKKQNPSHCRLAFTVKNMHIVTLYNKRYLLLFSFCNQPIVKSITDI